MNLPNDYTLPFFSYGLFQPGQIGFSGLRPFVKRHEGDWTVKGQLRERDGLPLLLASSEGVTAGTLIRFESGKEAHAYLVICGIEPGKLYRWETTQAHRGNESERVNILHGIDAQNGAHVPEWRIWDGGQEPLFKDALDVVTETLNQNRKLASESDLKPLFKLQMAYLLLWTAIERYASFRYHLGDRVVKKINRLASDPAFAAALRSIVPKETPKRHIYRCDDPSEKETLDPDNPKKALGYYFQLRSNITHRGKAVFRDHEKLATSLDELLRIFRKVLEAEIARE